MHGINSIFSLNSSSKYYFENQLLEGLVEKFGVNDAPKDTWVQTPLWQEITNEFNLTTNQDLEQKVLLKRWKNYQYYKSSSGPDIPEGPDEHENSALLEPQINSRYLNLSYHHNYVYILGVECSKKNSKNVNKYTL